jgi:ribonucleoside-diphosphate reductase alpha chain
MGLQDAFFTLRLPFDSAEASELSTRVQEEIFLTALETSAVLATEFGAHPGPGGYAGVDTALDWTRLDAAVRVAVRFLDRVVDRNFYPTEQAKRSNSRWRPVALGVMGLQDVFFALRLPFDSADARELSTRIAERVMLTAYETSCDLAAEDGPLPAWRETRAARGVLHPDHYDVSHHWPQRWEALRARIATTGMRNALLLAIAPTATIASIAGAYECIEPQVSNLFKRETLSGEFLQVNPYLVADLKRFGLWDERTREALREAGGSVADIARVPAELRTLYRTAWELPQRAVIDLAAARTPYLDQSQSLNLFLETPTIGKLSSMYAYAWRQGLNTTYYLRSRPATRIARAAAAEAVVTALVPAQAAPVPQVAGHDAVACSLENPESCEACQ